MNTLTEKKIFGFNFISNATNEEIATNIISKNYKIKDKIYPFLITPNVDQIVKFLHKDNSELYEFYKASAYILPDGQPIVWSSQLLNKKLSRRLTGSDFFPVLWNEIKNKNKKTLLIIPRESIASKLEQEYPNCKCYVPPYFKTKTKEYLIIKKEIQQLIKTYQPEFLFIGLGFPKQEILAKDLYIELDDKKEFPLTLLLGASFEFYTNEIKRAPKWIQKIGFEWFYRFLQEPKRMFKRYFIDDVKFVSLVYQEYIKNKQFTHKEK